MSGAAKERSELAGVPSVREAGIPPSSEGDKERLRGIPAGREGDKESLRVAWRDADPPRAARSSLVMAIDHRRVAFGLCGIRIANGLVLSLAPSAAAVLYLGPDAKTPTARALARFTGVRELVLGVGAAAAVATRRSDAEAIAAGAVCDAVDFVVSALSPGIAARTRLAAPTAAAGAALGAWTTRALARERAATASVLPG